MLKKIICLGVLLVMCLGLFFGCGSDLDEYKATKSAELQSYADEKGESNYCMDGWTAICNAVTQGKTNIVTATNKSGVDMAFTIAADAIAEVPHEENMGAFYSLQKAYDDGLLTIDDLRSVAYYQSGGDNKSDIVPITKSPENLSDEKEQAIMETYMVVLRAQTHNDGTPMFPYAKIADITVLGYYGTYNGAIAIKISDSYSGYPAVVKELEVAGVIFTYSGAVVTIWKAN